MAEDLCLNLQNGTKLFVPNRLDAITTYVILEQERWFEKEWGFIEHLLLPGMTAIDIGANLGIYSVAMAKAVGPEGRVYAYEPTSDTRARLEKSKTVNGADNLTVIGSALSDTEREGRIVFGPSSELNRLGEYGDGTGEAVHLTSLDMETARLGWGPIDFVKMDAEGEELKIIEGGKAIFEAGAPIVMFEVKSETGYEPRIARAFEALGYGLYRLLPDERHLVPFEEGEIDPFELNLFAVKPGTALQLAERGLLAVGGDAPSVRGDWPGFVSGMPFSMVSPLFAQTAPNSVYGAGLVEYAVWRDETLPLAVRYRSLREAIASFRSAARSDASLAHLLSLARAEYDYGQQSASYRLLVECATKIDAGSMPNLPFLPQTDRHETLTGDIKGWLLTSCVEALEQRSKHSSFYVSPLQQLEWLAGTRYATIELERRRALHAVISGRNVTLKKDLREPAPDHLNAKTWKELFG